MHQRFYLHAAHATILGIALCIAPTRLLWAAEATEVPQPPSKIFELAIANGRVVTANNTIRVKKGDHVELRWSSDRAMSLHLHGYDIEHRVTPQSPAVMSFKAHLAGRFSVSEHVKGYRHGKAVLYVEVHP